MPNPHYVFLTGAGMSAESGIRTFRDNNGLWEDHDVMEVASPEGWARDRALVNRFYNARRAQLKEVEPNAPHLAIAQLEQHCAVSVVTQNVDDLHERAGSTRVLHLHGELRKVRSERPPHEVLEWTGPLTEQDRASDGSPLRPHIVWFGEEVPLLEEAAEIVSTADRVVVVGTSMQVYPAASLVAFANASAQLYYVDPHPQLNHELKQRSDLRVIAEAAGTALPRLVEQWVRDQKKPSR